MARRPRVFTPGLLYHVIVGGNQHQATFLNERDYQAYLERLGTYRQKYDVVIWAYCLMPNHVHVLLETTWPPLAKFMQGLQQSYTQYFNRTHEKVGDVFQDCYKAIVCQSEGAVPGRLDPTWDVKAKVMTGEAPITYSRLVGNRIWEYFRSREKPTEIRST